MRLPIEDALPQLIETLAQDRRAVLEAPPGAGKTTRVPLAMLDADLTPGKILMLEPRRLAARAAAEQMAKTLGEPLGARVGYRIRGEAKVSAQTRIEVVTEGILTRMLQSDPSLADIGAVIFDEFHERSLQSDLGLALCLETASALREDLVIVVMSATLDATPVATLMGAARVTSEGRAFPVETRWRDTPLPPKTRIEDVTAQTVLTAMTETEGGVLVFLPGEGEIRRTAALLQGRVPEGVLLRPLYGAMPFKDQRRAIEPDATGRKVVLATAIAETSLTIEDIRVVVDAGRARRARFDPGLGMTRLVTEPVSRAEATQRQGRAGRVAPGVCYRLWTRAEEGALPAFPPPGIEVEDLSGLVLEIALWGARAPGDLPFLTPPPAGAYAAALRLLEMLGGVDADGALTDHGRAMARLPTHPRLAHMLLSGGSDAAPLAALLGERDPLKGGTTDLGARLDVLRRPTPAADKPTLQRINAEAKRLARLVERTSDLTPAQLLARAFPDRIGLRRKGDVPRWVMSGGTGARMDAGDPLAGARLIVVAETDGDAREARIRRALQISEAELREVAGTKIAWQDVCQWSRRDRRVQARRQERLGALVLEDRNLKDPDPAEMARAMCDGVRALGLNWTPQATRFRARVELVHAEDPGFPDMSETGLIDGLETWLLPHLDGVKTADDWTRFDMLPALRAQLSWEQQTTLDNRAPAHFETPLGRRTPIDYGGEHPSIEIRVQELFGQTRHPMVAGQPLRITLLSPAGRPVQVTMDLPGFWESSYAEVRKDMRGRYPKHPWPEDPRVADATLRAKPRR